MFSFGRILAALGGSLGDRPALIHGDTVVSWAEYDRQTNALAQAFLSAGAAAGDRVAHLMRNSPAYSLTLGASFKARMVHVNVNYRYTGAELLHILQDSDSAIVVFDAEFADTLANLRAQLPDVRLWLQVGGVPPPWAQNFETAASGAATPVQAEHKSDDLLLLYTGGTTGMPKGVMWDQGILWEALGGGAPEPGAPMPATVDKLLAQINAAETGRKILILPPLMHGTGLVSAINTLMVGGTVITTTSENFDPVEALQLAEKYNPEILVIVGDAFARPLLRALDAGRGRLGQVGTMLSSGTMWSPEVKAGLIGHCPGLICADSYGSSEGIGYGVAMAASGTENIPARFVHDGRTTLIDVDEDSGETRLIRHPGQAGRVARSGPLPRGYWKDPEKSARTFVTVDGQRYTMPGDWGVLEPDGSITLLGRGSQCINSGGEKIFPEEVEEILKTHPAIEDALVFGVADEKWGQAVTAVVEALRNVPEAELVAHVRQYLAAYKAPKRIVTVAKVPRAPNGKARYDEARRLFEAAAASAAGNAL